jgi:hypothetical protein
MSSSSKTVEHNAYVPQQLLLFVIEQNCRAQSIMQTATSTRQHTDREKKERCLGLFEVCSTPLLYIKSMNHCLKSMELESDMPGLGMRPSIRASLAARDGAFADASSSGVSWNTQRRRHGLNKTNNTLLYCSTFHEFDSRC